MMLSVRKRTTGPIKFWLFENYLLSFKEGAQALNSKKVLMAYATISGRWLGRRL